MDIHFFKDQTKLCVPLMAKNPEELQNFCEEIKGKSFDIIEWRVDGMERDFLDEMHALLKSYFPNIPILATVRTKKEGGLYAGGNYAALVERILDQGYCDIIDLENERVDGSKLLAKARERNILILLSYHCWEKSLSRKELFDKYEEMLTKGGDILKIAMKADTYKETATILYAAAVMHEVTKRPVIGIAMGEKGKLSRVAGPEMGAPLTFISLVGSSAPGQWEAEKAKLVLKELDFVE